MLPILRIGTDENRFPPSFRNAPLVEVRAVGDRSPGVDRPGFVRLVPAISDVDRPQVVGSVVYQEVRAAPLHRIELGPSRALSR